MQSVVMGNYFMIIGDEHCWQWKDSSRKKHFTCVSQVPDLQHRLKPESNLIPPSGQVTWFRCRLALVDRPLIDVDETRDAAPLLSFCLE
jgi:hypothetical protein